MMPDSPEVIVIGAGHAGLSTSYYLTLQGRSHLVLEAARIGESWRSRRWDSFTLVTPNWMLNLPGFPYRGQDQDGFLPREEVVDYLERYAASFGAPVRQGVRVEAVELAPSQGGYHVRTRQHGDLAAPVVVVATGFFEMPRIPAVAERLPPSVVQIHSSAYKRPDQLPAGAVLVVGSGQSGCQIAEELHESGRRVYLSTGGAGRLPRRYRGKDGTEWAKLGAKLEQTLEMLESPLEAFQANPHNSGKRGGHTLNLHAFARDGITLLGRFRDVSGEGRLQFAPDLKANLAKADEFAANLKTSVDAAIQKLGLPIPAASPENSDDYDGDDGYRQDEVLELAIEEAGITAVVWANGFSWDYSLVKVPGALDESGLPVHVGGVSPLPGLYFMGVHFQTKFKSDIFYGVGEDAAQVAEHIASTRSVLAS